MKEEKIMDEERCAERFLAEAEKKVATGEEASVAEGIEAIHQELVDAKVDITHFLADALRIARRDAKAGGTA